MSIKDHLQYMIGKNSRVARLLFDDISETESMERGSYSFNHIRWQVGHMLYSDTHALALLGGNLKTNIDLSRLFGVGSVCSDNASDYPAFAELREHLYAVYDLLAEAMEKATEADLTRIDGEGDKAAPVWEHLTIRMMHDFYHDGQVVHIRKVLGRDRPFA